MTIGQPLDSQPTTDASARWRDDASCRFMSLDLFFPSHDARVGSAEIQVAKAVCGGCPVQEACLLYALETNQKSGIWGGTTEDERRRLRRTWAAGRRRRAKAIA